MSTVDLVIGKGNNGFQFHDLSDVCIVGGVRDGKSALMKNLIRQLVLRYTEKDVRIWAWDYEGCITQTSKGSILGCRIVDRVETCGTKTLYNFMKEVFMLSCFRHERNKYLPSEIKTPVIVFIDDFNMGFKGLSEDRKNDINVMLKSILEKSETSGVYMVISSNQQTNVGFDTLVIKSREWCSSIVSSVKSIYPTKQIEGISIVDKKEAIVLSKEYSYWCEVPFYNNKKIRDIVNGDLIPNGVIFSKLKLKELERTL